MEEGLGYGSNGAPIYELRRQTESERAKLHSKPPGGLVDAFGTLWILLKPDSDRICQRRHP